MLPPAATRHSTHQVPIVPGARVRYLADIADGVRGYKKQALAQARLAREVQQLRESARMLTESNPVKTNAVGAVLGLAEEREARLDPECRRLLGGWPELQRAYAGDEFVVKVRDKEIRTSIVHTTLSGSKIRKVALPAYEDHGEILKWLLLDNVPGSFPYAAGEHPGRVLVLALEGEGAGGIGEAAGHVVEQQPLQDLAVVLVGG